MKVSSINQTNFNAQVRIIAAKNKHVPFLYNDLLKISREHKVATTFYTKEVIFPSVSEDIISEIKNLGIKIANNKKPV